MDRRDAPPTEEGWFALHDLRTIDWDAWRGATEREREQAIEEGSGYLRRAEAVEDAEEGASVTYAGHGHKADLLIVHLRPTLAALNVIERRFEHTALADFTDRASSYVSVTEVSGYTSQAFFEEDEVEDQGLKNYIEMRLHPTIPDAEYVCFYPMNKRRDPEYNWYDLPFEDRAEHMESHGDIGRDYAGKVTQMITGSVGFDDWEWGVTLWANDPVQFKRLLYEMRFDPSTSRFAEFGPFVTGQRLPPDRLDAFLAGEPLGEPTEAGDELAEPTEDMGGRQHAAAGTPPHGTEDEEPDEGTIRDELAELGIYAGQPHGEDVFAMVLYSTADAETLFEELDGLRRNFDHYDTHVKTAAYESHESDDVAVVSIWETQRAAETAGGFLSDLPGIGSRANEGAGFGTMGMFYTVKSEHRDEFVDAFDDVVDLLETMDGHRETMRFENRENEDDMFIASRWRTKEDAMEFFRSEAFRDTVDWGREVLADRPRHVFLA